MKTPEIKKRPFDQFGHGVRFHRAVAIGDYLASCTLTATLQEDGSDVTGTFLASSSATIPSGTATGGSTTTIVNTGQNHGVNGVLPGDWVVNRTKGWVREIKELRTTTNPNDTLAFSEVSAAAEAADEYQILKAIAVLRAGTDGQRVLVKYAAVTNSGDKFEGSVMVDVEAA